MREIKFRAWDKNKKGMIESALRLLSSGLVTAMFEESEDLVWMQYTGLTDKNGVDIYEGEVLSNKSGYLLKVVFDYGVFCAISLIDDEVCDVDLLYNILPEYFSVGNVYQNHELMESK